MGKIRWGGMEFENSWLIQTKKCVTCREDIPENEININGMCDKCVEIENRMLDRLAGKWANKVLEDDDKQIRNQLGWW